MTATLELAPYSEGAWLAEVEGVRQTSPYNGLYDTPKYLSLEKMFNDPSAYPFVVRYLLRLRELNDTHRIVEFVNDRHRDIGLLNTMQRITQYMATDSLAKEHLVHNSCSFVDKAFLGDDELLRCRARRNYRLLSRLIWETATRRLNGKEDLCLHARIEKMLFRYCVPLSVADVRRWYHQVRKAFDYGKRWGGLYSVDASICYAIACAVMERKHGARAMAVALAKFDIFQSCHYRQLEYVYRAILNGRATEVM